MKNYKIFEKGIIIVITLMAIILLAKIIYFQLDEDYPFEITYKQKEMQKTPEKYVVKTKKRINSNKNSSKKNKTINLTVKKKKININIASKTELITIKGIGKKTAEKIIKYRNVSGFFKNKEDLLKIKGIGQKKLNKIKSQIIISK